MKDEPLSEHQPEDAILISFKDFSTVIFRTVGHSKGLLKLGTVYKSVSLQKEIMGRGRAELVTEGFFPPSGP